MLRTGCGELVRRHEEERIAIAERVAERAREAERLRLASYVVAKPKTRVNYIVFFVDSADKPSSEITSVVVEHFGRNGISAAGSVFSDAFISPQGFAAVITGKAAGDVVAMQLADVADRLLLITGGAVQSVPANSVPGVQTYSMPMTISLTGVDDGKKHREFVINDVTGAGLNEESARAAFVERFAEILAARMELRAGLP
ncbi:MAG: hypothetical protein AABZ47_04135 [Planctomycetota bacterium]